MKIKFCGKCGRELTEGSGFCQFCGWKVVRLESEDIDSDRESPLVNSPDEPTRINPAETAGEKSEPLPLNTSLSRSQNKKKFPLPFLIGVVLLITAGMILWQTIFKSAELMQPPLVTEKGIFFADFGRDSRLYRLDLNGKNKTKLSDEYVKNMASDDGWIYYSGILGLHKIREDGTGETEVLKQSAESLQVADGWIYFIESRDYHICRVKTDGTAFEEIGQDFATNLNQDDGWLYYQNVDAEHSVYRIRTDGTNQQPVTPESCYSYSVADGIVYYSNRNEYGYLYRIQGDGTGQRKLNEYSSASMVIANGWIYYAQGWQGYPAKIKTDGSGEVLLNKDSADDLAVSGEGLYYAHTEKGRRLFRIKTDGSGRQSLN